MGSKCRLLRPRLVCLVSRASPAGSGAPMRHPGLSSRSAPSCAASLAAAGSPSRVLLVAARGGRTWS
eukprot:8810329-Alexandrium_andersonii.AAC.1